MIMSKILRRIVAHPPPLSTSLSRTHPVLPTPIPTRIRYLSTTATIDHNEEPTSSEPSNTSSSSDASFSSPSLEPDTPPAPTTESESEDRPRVSLPYFVHRNTLNSLGVYQKKKRGGNLKYTVVKNLEGDLYALRNDLREMLELKESEVTVNTVTRHIKIAGHRKIEVFRILGVLGF
ncbi:mitochondrial large subunit ribosomal protein-domain-containing protein [Jackrogersella minutella]|nr:mitochondrial large subunit ribosomal protein-domain-containing protein [Jackrogersella minutella]